jgi:hypothetical protein
VNLTCRGSRCQTKDHSETESIATAEQHAIGDSSGQRPQRAVVAA